MTAGQAQRAARLLVVDHDTSTREGLAELLRDEGFDVACASNGREALALFNAFAPDLVLTDPHMPGNGHSMIESVARHHAPVPVIVITAYPLAFCRRRAAELGVVDVLVKPIDLDDLLRRVVAALSGAGVRSRADPR